LRRCDPDQCSEADKHYWRSDAAGPEVTQSTESSSSSRSSIVSISKVRSSVPHPLFAVDWTRSSAPRLGVVLDGLFSPILQTSIPRDYLFEFNPSLVQLPVSQIPATLGVDMTVSNGDNGNGGAVYLASFRVSNMHNCVTDPTLCSAWWWNWPRRRAQVKDYLGLALSRADSICGGHGNRCQGDCAQDASTTLCVVTIKSTLGSYHRMTPCGWSHLQYYHIIS
jgi:hypothetical protein